MRLGTVTWIATLTVASATARAQRWDDATGATIGDTGEWTNKVEVADLDGDGWVDILFANGGDYDEAGAPEPQRVFRNLGNWAAAGPHFAEITDSVFGAAATRLARVIKVGDLDADGDLDLFVGGAHGTDSGLFLRRAGGGYDDRSATNLPPGPVALGDAELGDLDGDGDLDLAAVDWGGPPLTSTGPVRLWLNDGAARFTAAPADRTPATTIGWSWDLELVDVDDDADLDLLVSCKRCTGGRLWKNDGTGRFTDASADLPQRANNYDYEAMDVDGDGDLDLATVNDGPSQRETLLINEDGRFTDQSAALLAGAANPANSDDNVVAFLDVDSDRDADLIVGSLSDPDRLLRNDGAAGFTLVAGALPLATPGTLGLALADLDKDGRHDVVQGQGEVTMADAVQLAAATNARDTAVPVIKLLRPATRANPTLIARIHDRRSPSRLHDWRRVVLEIGGPGTRPAIAMRWIGEYLWTATVPDEPPPLVYRVCATDTAGNPFCARDESLDPASDAGADATPVVEDPPHGCCATGGGARGAWLSIVVALGLARRRRRQPIAG